jgi:NAD-dependent SIR2 family protein deacetylase
MSATPTYQKLYDLVKDKNYFVITTNVDRQFIKSGFDSKKVFEVQGSLTKIQCARACHNKLYDDTKMVKDMLQENKVNKIPTNLIPKCPVCGGKMEVNLRKDFFFVEDDYWEEHNDAYVKFLKSYQDKKILFLELGVGFNTPGIIRYPFEELTKKYPKAFLIRMNDSEAGVPFDIKSKSLEIKGDINKILESGDDVERKSNV